VTIFASGDPDLELTPFSKHLAHLRALLVAQHGESYVAGLQGTIERQARILANEGDLLTAEEFDPAKLDPRGLRKVGMAE